ncbi:MAG: hypothetical protein IPN08_06475 [Bacteroidales bacterium]|nr:hypothetical protein [Bacteroidales bacterium]
MKRNQVDASRYSCVIWIIDYSKTPPLPMTPDIFGGICSSTAQANNMGFGLSVDLYISKPLFEIFSCMALILLPALFPIFVLAHRVSDGLKADSSKVKGVMS